jgi:hypothetical protein
MNYIQRKLQSFEKIAIASVALLLPGISFAQTTSGGCKTSLSSIKDIFTLPTCIINTYLVPTLITVAFFAFFVGVTRYLTNLDNADIRKKTGSFIMWSILALFIIMSVWAILYVVGNTLQLGK